MKYSDEKRYQAFRAFVLLCQSDEAQGDEIADKLPHQMLDSVTAEQFDEINDRLVEIMLP